MAFIGTPLDTRNTFQSLAGKRFDGDGSTTAFTLDVAPSSTLDIEVFVGNVRQDPNSAYTLSGTTLTFTGAPPSGTNNIYVVHQAKSVGTIDVPDSYKSDAQTISGARTHTGAITANAGITMGGTTPTLTIGDAGAEDAKIVFDGNAQDYHIGLDDSADDLVIGKGSALGTTAHIVTDENGHVTKPLQTYVYAYASADQTLTANDADETIQLNKELFDLNADFNISNYTFTAPVSGIYSVTVNFYISGDLNSNITDQFFYLNASNGKEVLSAGQFHSEQVSTASSFRHCQSLGKIIQMDASDTLVLIHDSFSGAGNSHQFNLEGVDSTSGARDSSTSMQICLLG
jgi:hypothetical protein